MTDEISSGADEVRLTALGSTFLVTGTSEQAAATLRGQWSRLPGEGPGDGHQVTIDLRSVHEGQQGRALLSQVTIRAIEAAAGTRLMLHAAGLADARGRVLALVGPSGMGKTTASIYLSRRGYGYVTDETVSIGLAGDVLPFPRPLSLRRPEGEVQRSPDQLGLGVPSSDLSIARIVLLNRVGAHAGPPTLTAVPLVDALLDLIPHASALARLPDPLQFMSRVVDRCGGVLRLTYADMDAPVLSLLAELLGVAVDAPEPWRELLPRRPATVAGRQVLQGEIRDGIVSDEEGIVLVDDVPIRLGEIGLTIWEAAGTGLAPEEIVLVVEKMHGAHPDASRLVGEAVEKMLEVGLLVTGSRRLMTARTATR